MTQRRVTLERFRAAPGRALAEVKKGGRLLLTKRNYDYCAVIGLRDLERLQSLDAGPTPPTKPRTLDDVFSEVGEL